MSGQCCLSRRFTGSLRAGVPGAEGLSSRSLRAGSSRALRRAPGTLTARCSRDGHAQARRRRRGSGFSDLYVPEPGRKRGPGSRPLRRCPCHPQRAHLCPQGALARAADADPKQRTREEPIGRVPYRRWYPTDGSTGTTRFSPRCRHRPRRWARTHEPQERDLSQKQESDV